MKPSVVDEVLGAWLLDTPSVVLLVDADEEAPSARETLLRDALTRNDVPGAVGVSVKEFESWLLADPDALESVTGMRSATVADPESLTAGVAKEWLQNVLAPMAGPNRSLHSVRREFAEVAAILPG